MVACRAAGPRARSRRALTPRARAPPAPRARHRPRAAGARSPNLDIRKKCLDITLDLITPRNIAEVVHALKKEVSRSKAAEEADSSGSERSAEYNELLIHAIHSCAVKFPDVAETVVPVLMDFLADQHQTSALDVALFVREIVEVHTQLRPSVMAKALDVFPTVHSARVLRITLWLLGEYCHSADEVARAFQTVKGALGSLPLLPADESAAAAAADGADADGKPAAPKSAAVRTTVLADGTYASTPVMPAGGGGAGGGGAGSGKGAGMAGGSVPGLKLRELIVGGDFFLAAVAGTALTKLALRSREHVPDTRIANLVTADVMAILIGMLRLGQSRAPEQRIDADSADRLSICLQLLSVPSAAVSEHFLRECHASFAELLADKKAAEAEQGAAEGAKGLPGAEGAAAKQPDLAPEAAVRQVDALLNIRQLKGGAADVELDTDDHDIELSALTGNSAEADDFSQRLKRVTQLTARARSAEGGARGGRRARPRAEPPPPRRACPPAPPSPPSLPHHLHPRPRAGHVRPRVRRGLRDRAPVRHRSRRARCQPERRDDGEPHARAGDGGRPEAVRAAAGALALARRVALDPRQHQGGLDRDRHRLRLDRVRRDRPGQR